MSPDRAPRAGRPLKTLLIDLVCRSLEQGASWDSSTSTREQDQNNSAAQDDTLYMNEEMPRLVKEFIQGGE